MRAHWRQALAEPGAVAVTARVQRQVAGLFVAEERGSGHCLGRMRAHWRQVRALVRREDERADGRPGVQQNKGYFLHFVLETPHSLSTRPDALADLLPSRIYSKSNRGLVLKI
jgi:hypothetical protein